MTLSEPGWAGPAGTAAEAIRLLTRQAAFLTAPADTTAEAPPLPDRQSLPPDLLALVDRWEAGHAGERLTPLRVLTAGSPNEQVADAEPLPPPPEGFVALAITETIVDIGGVAVQSRVLLAARSAAED